MISFTILWINVLFQSTQKQTMFCPDILDRMRQSNLTTTSFPRTDEDNLYPLLYLNCSLVTNPILLGPEILESFDPSAVYFSQSANVLTNLTTSSSCDTLLGYIQHDADISCSSLIETNPAHITLSLALFCSNLVFLLYFLIK